MIIKKIDIKNFKSYKNFCLSFEDDVNVIVGNNGFGKTALLDAIAVSLGGYLSALDSIKSSREIKKEEVRLESFALGERVDVQPQYPVEVSCNAVLNEKVISWTRELRTEDGRTTRINAKEMTAVGREIQKSVRSGDKDIMLPLISYYGTGRLWLQKKRKKDASKVSFNNRFLGYMDCMEPASNEKFMIQWFAVLENEYFMDGIEPAELKVVKKALKHLLNRCYDLNDGDRVEDIRYNPRIDEIEIAFINIINEKYKLPMSALSDGYRNTLGLVADMIQRACLLNPQLGERALDETRGVVLIDEIDQHLHPKWQRHIISDLKSLFPKVQFIVTTHSPSILSTIEKEKLIMLNKDEVSEYNPHTYGRDVNSILLDVMEVSERLPEIQKEFDAIYEALEEERYNDVDEMISEFEKIIGKDDPEIIRLKIMLKFEWEA